MNEPTGQTSPTPTFDSLGAIDALEASGFSRPQAAALSEQLLLAVNTRANQTEEKLEALTAAVGKAVRQIRRTTVAFTGLNLAIWATILATLALR